MGLDQPPLPGAMQSAAAALPPPLKDQETEKDKSSDSLLSGSSSSRSSQRSSMGKLSEKDCEIFVSQPVLHRTGWDLHGKVEDEEDSPMRKLAGLKFKYRYPIPNDLNVNQHSGFMIVRQWSLAAIEMKWKKRFIIIKDNKAYVLKSTTDKDATAIIKLDDCIINPVEFGQFPHSFWLTPPPGALNETNGGKEFMWIMIAPTEDLKVEWIAAFMKGAGWREQHLTESGQVPTITVHRPEVDTPLLNPPFTLLDVGQSSSGSLANMESLGGVSIAGSPSPSVVTGMTAPSFPESPHNSPSTSIFPSSAASPELRSVKSSPSLRSPVIDTIFPFPVPDVSTLAPLSAGDAGTGNGSKSKLESNEALKLMCASNARFFKNGGFKSASSLIKGAERRLSHEANDWAKQKAVLATRKQVEVLAESVKGSEGGTSPPSSSRRATSPTIRNNNEQQAAPNASKSSVASEKKVLPRRQTSPKLPKPHGGHPDERDDLPSMGVRRAAESMGSIH
ncbi:hypothetical protein BDR26DRAFT_856308 [Obelidium mucronatum]|nr:hypothetical protein BDR26DRAFT_856308 [Obelidium mucronatum]